MKFKKVMVMLAAVAMSFNLVACGGSSSTKPAEASVEAPASTPAPAATPAPVESTEAEAAESTEADVATEEAAADSEQLEYTLDYDAIASWVDSGFIGNDASGAPVVMAIDEANENAIIIFGDNSDMTAVSFVGSITYTETEATITDETNELTLTFGVNQTAEDTIELDMGDVGSATIKAADKEAVLETIKNAIDNYKHIA